MVNVDEQGWNTTLPLPMFEQALAIKQELLQEYEEVEITGEPWNFVVRYRKRREQRG